MERNERRIAGMTLFWVCVLATMSVGLTVAYCSGIIDGINHIANLPLSIPRWLVIATPPVLFFHLGLALFLVLRQNVYTQNGKAVRACTWVFWIATMVATAIFPYFIMHGMAIAAYVVSAVATAFALGTTILMYRHSVGAGVVMTVFSIAITLIMVFLAYWAF